MERSHDMVVWDTDQKADPLAGEVLGKYALSAGSLIPISFRNKFHGFLLVGYARVQAEHAREDTEVLRIFQKQIGIALENDALIRRNKELAVRDETTGVYNDRYIHERLNEEIRRAIVYQRPCGYIQFSVDYYDDYVQKNSLVAGQEALKKIARIVLSVNGVKTCHKIRTRGREDDIHVDLHVQVKADMHVDRAHEISYQIEKAIKEGLSGVTDVVVHIEKKLPIVAGCMGEYTE